MSPRILGYAVLVYAAFTSATAMQLIGFLLGQLSDRWGAYVEIAVWLAFVSGGIGLLNGRGWSRLVLLIAAATSTVQRIVSIVLLWTLELPLQVVLFDVFMMLLPVAIFVGALKLPAPAAWRVQPSAHPVPKRVVPPNLDLAYGCFAWIAFAICAIQLASLLPLDVTTAQGLGMLVGIPVVLAMLAAGIVAVVLSIVEWREWPLPAMSAVSASMLLTLLAEIEWKLIGSSVALAWYIGSTALLVFFCVRWFAFTRRRAAQTPATGRLGPWDRARASRPAADLHKPPDDRDGG